MVKKQAKKGKDSSSVWRMVLSGAFGTCRTDEVSYLPGGDIGDSTGSSWESTTFFEAVPWCLFNPRVKRSRPRK